MGIRKRVFEIIEKAQGRDIPSRIFDITIIVLIVLNTLAVVINSFNELSNLTVQILRHFEIIW